MPQRLKRSILSRYEVMGPQVICLEPCKVCVCNCKYVSPLGRPRVDEDRRREHSRDFVASTTSVVSTVSLSTTR
jgi:hypothetical protein